MDNKVEGMQPPKCRYCENLEWFTVPKSGYSGGRDNNVSMCRLTKLVVDRDRLQKTCPLNQ